MQATANHGPRGLVVMDWGRLNDAHLQVAKACVVFFCLFVAVVYVVVVVIIVCVRAVLIGC